MDKYKLRDFAKWAKAVRLTDKALHDALDEMNRGLLGGSVRGGNFQEAHRAARTRKARWCKNDSVFQTT
jgi:hypothetical protein